MKIEKVENTSDVSVNKVQKTYDALVKIFQKNKLSVKEILIVLGNLTYTLGASIGEYKDKGPGINTLQELYLKKPTIDVAMMISGLQFQHWVLDLDKKYEELKKELESNANKI